MTGLVFCQAVEYGTAFTLSAAPNRCGSTTLSLLRRPWYVRLVARQILRNLHTYRGLSIPPIFLSAHPLVPLQIISQTSRS
jgi:hypothetical protein